MSLIFNWVIVFCLQCLFSRIHCCNLTVYTVKDRVVAATVIVFKTLSFIRISYWAQGHCQSPAVQVSLCYLLTVFNKNCKFIIFLVLKITNNGGNKPERAELRMKMTMLQKVIHTVNRWVENLLKILLPMKKDIHLNLPKEEK